MEPHHETYDYVIIGGGTAGLALAARLSEDPAVQVAVLESGEDKTADPRVATPAMWPLLLKSDLDWDFRTTKQVITVQTASTPAHAIPGVMFVRILTL